MKKELFLKANRHSKETYSLTQIMLHWSIAALVIYQLVINKEIKLWYKQNQTSLEVPYYSPGAWLHIVLGITIFSLMSYRLFKRIRTGTPALPKNSFLPLILLARLSHYSLYLLLFSMPLSGFFGWYLEIKILIDVHYLLSKILVGLILFHVCAAMFHEGVLGNKIIKRMLPPDTNTKH